MRDLFGTVKKETAEDTEDAEDCKTKSKDLLLQSSASSAVKNPKVIENFVLTSARQLYFALSLGTKR